MPDRNSLAIQIRSTLRTVGQLLIPLRVATAEAQALPQRLRVTLLLFWF